MSTTAITYVKKLVPRSVRNWLKSPRHTSRWLWDETRHFLGANPSLRIRPSWALTCHPAAYRFARHEQMDDPEQRKEFDAFIRSIIPGTILLDIGAHFGIFSFAALQHGGPSARAIAVDASPTATRMIQVQARLNHFEPARLAVVNAMVGASPGEGEMVPVGVIAGGYFVTPSASHAASDRVRIPMTTVDELVGRHGIAPTHLKIDVEGAEASVLRGAKDTLSKFSPTLYLELHHAMIEKAGGSKREAIDILTEWNYCLSDTDGEPISAEAALAHKLIRLRADRPVSVT